MSALYDSDRAREFKWRYKGKRFLSISKSFRVLCYRNKRI